MLFFRRSESILDKILFYSVNSGVCLWYVHPLLASVSLDCSKLFLALHPSAVCSWYVEDHQYPDYDVSFIFNFSSSSPEIRFPSTDWLRFKPSVSDYRSTSSTYLDGISPVYSNSFIGSLNARSYIRSAAFREEKLYSPRNCTPVSGFIFTLSPQRGD